MVQKHTGVTGKLANDKVIDPYIQRCTGRRWGKVHGSCTGQGCAGGQGCGVGAVTGLGSSACNRASVTVSSK